MVDVTVVGAGVLGLTCAGELARAGHRVQVLSAPGVPAVSPVAAAIWFPHDVPHTPQVLASAQVAYDRLTALATDPATGVRVRSGVVLSRRPDPDLSWTASVPEHQVLASGCTPPGTAGVRCTVPVALTDVYLAWLRADAVRQGVVVRERQVQDLDEVETDVIVVAAGLASAALLGDDDEVFPIRGQVVRVANPGLTDWVSDDDHPDGLTYVVPRDGDVVCGGTGDVGAWEQVVDPEVEAGILARCTSLVPELAGAPVLSRAVGLRPGRSAPRVERVPGHKRPVVACYGHGGAGFTLSWGEAQVVARLVAEA